MRSKRAIKKRGDSIVRIGLKRYIKLRKRLDRPRPIFHYFIGTRARADSFSDAVKSHLSVTDVVLRRRILGKRIKKTDRPRFAYQVLPRIYTQLNASLKADCSATQLPVDWYEFVIED